MNLAQQLDILLNQEKALPILNARASTLIITPWRCSKRYHRKKSGSVISLTHTCQKKRWGTNNINLIHDTFIAETTDSTSRLSLKEIKRLVDVFGNIGDGERLR